MNSKWLVLLLFGAWSFFSWRYYVCNIKQQCPGKEAQTLAAGVPEVTPITSTTPSDATTGVPDSATTAASDPNGSAFSSGDATTAATNAAAAATQTATTTANNGATKPDGKKSGNTAKPSAPDPMSEGGDAPTTTAAAPTKTGGAAEDHVSIEETADEAIIHFPYNSTRKVDNDEMDAYLSKLAKRLKASTERVTITGHTDGIGESAANNALALQRAQSIRAILVKKGVKAKAITCRSFGERKPVASDDTPAGRYRNRRAIITVQ